VGVAILWFRRDLRLDINSGKVALTAAPEQDWLSEFSHVAKRSFGVRDLPPKPAASACGGLPR
jgi:hypothetical protein